jgi:predicted nucleic acid-binding protein
MASIAARGDFLSVTKQNLVECWVVCTRPVANNGFGLSPAVAERVLSRIEGAMVQLTEEGNTVYQEWRRLVVEYGVSGKKSHDARLVAAMKVHEITHLLTFNVGDFQRFAGIVAMHPREWAETGSDSSEPGL